MARRLKSLRLDLGERSYTPISVKTDELSPEQTATETGKRSGGNHG